MRGRKKRKRIAQPIKSSLLGWTQFMLTCCTFYSEINSYILTAYPITYVVAAKETNSRQRKLKKFAPNLYRLLCY